MEIILTYIISFLTGMVSMALLIQKKRKDDLDKLHEEMAQAFARLKRNINKL